MNEATKQPVGEPFAVMHFHSAARWMSSIPLYPLEMAVAPDRLVVVLDEQHGNIWMTQTR